MNQTLKEIISNYEQRNGQRGINERIGIAFFTQFFSPTYEGLRNVSIEQLQRLPTVQKYILREERFAMDMRLTLTKLQSTSVSDWNAQKTDIEAEIRDLTRKGGNNPHTLDNAIYVISQRMIFQPNPWEEATIRCVGDSVRAQVSTQSPNGQYAEFQAVLKGVQKASQTPNGAR